MRPLLRSIRFSEDHCLSTPRNIGYHNRIFRVQFPPMIARTHHLDELSRLLARYPVVAILGARQTGKTALANELLRRGTRFDLEDSGARARAHD